MGDWANNSRDSHLSEFIDLTREARRPPILAWNLLLNPVGVQDSNAYCLGLAGLSFTFKRRRIIGFRAAESFEQLG